jgi:hypothetical protein
MDMTFLKSNQPIPLRGQQVTVALLGPGGAQLSSAQVTTDASGNVQVADVGAATQIRITDRFGNVATATIP